MNVCEPKCFLFENCCGYVFEIWKNKMDLAYENFPSILYSTGLKYPKESTESYLTNLYLEIYYL